MKTRIRSRWIGLGACAMIMSCVAAHAHAADANRACALVTAAELKTVLGDEVTLKPLGGTGGVAICNGTTSKASVLLRVATKRQGSGDAAKAGIEAARKMGAQVDVKTFGPITCSTMVPPESLAAHGFNTTCSITKGTSLAAIEITAKTKADMVSIEGLKTLAEKMAGRL